jgi:hypothetical protein
MNKPMSKPLIVLVAGPYRSGTGDDPQKIAANLEMLEKAALQVWEKGHIPLVGEWVAIPLMSQTGNWTLGDAIFTSFAYPVAERLLARCDAVLRLPGESRGTDQDVVLARKRNLPVYHSIEQVPSDAATSKKRQAIDSGPVGRAHVEPSSALFASAVRSDRHSEQHRL